MVIVLPSQTVDVHSDTRSLSKTLQNMRNHLAAEVTDLFTLQVEFNDGIRTVGEVNDGTGEGLWLTNSQRTILQSPYMI